MGRTEKINFLTILLAALFLLYINRHMIDSVFASLSTSEEFLLLAGFSSIADFTGRTSALRQIKNENGDRTRLAASLEDISGVNLTKMFAYSERRENYPASLNCLRKVKSYQVLAYFGGALTHASVGIVFIYIMAETRFNNSLTFVIGVILILLAESAIIRTVTLYHDVITSFVGSEGLDQKLISSNPWDTLKRSLTNLITGMLFISLAMFFITNIGTLSTFANHPKVLWGVHYLIIFASLTSGVGWIGSAVYQVLPHISQKYADFDLPNPNDAIFTDVQPRPDGTFLFQTAREDDENKDKEEETSL